MKSFLISMIIFLILLCSYDFANDSKYIKPKEKFKNSYGDSVYLILELKPGEQFQNNTDRIFQVIQDADLSPFNFRLKLDSEIEQYVDKIKADTTKLNEIESELKNKIDKKLKLEKGNEQ